MRLVQAGQRHARVADHGFAVPGGPHAARQPLEQRHLQHVLQVLEQLGRRRLRHVEHLGRAVDVALLGQRHQQQQLPRLEARADEPVGVVGHGGFIPNAWIDIAFCRNTRLERYPIRFLDCATRLERRLEAQRAASRTPGTTSTAAGRPACTTGISENPSDTREVVAEYARADRSQAELAIRAAADAFAAVEPQHAAAPRRRAGPDRQRTARAQGRTGHAAGARRRQDPARGHRRSRRAPARSSSSSPARRCASPARRMASVRPGVQVDVTREPVGVVGHHRAVELPVRHPGLEDRAGAGLRQHRGVQAGRTGAGLRLGAGRDHQPRGLPAGVFNLVMGSGREVGQALVDSPLVDAHQLHRLGRHRRAASCRPPRRARAKVQLEMGGKNPLVVLADADLDQAVDCAVQGAYFSTGQRCTASSRLIVEAPRARRLRRAAAPAHRGAQGRARAGARHRDRARWSTARQLEQNLGLHGDRAATRAPSTSWGGELLRARRRPATT